PVGRSDADRRRLTADESGHGRHSLKDRGRQIVINPPGCEAGRVVSTEPDKPEGTRIAYSGDRPESDPIQETEPRRRRADAYGKREHDERGEARALGERAQRVANIA